MMILAYEQILGLDVSMNDGVAPAVKMFDCLNYIFYILFHLMLWQPSVVFELIMDWTSLGIL